VLPFFEAHDVRLLRILTDRGSEYCGNLQQHKYELYLAFEHIDHTKTKAKSPQTNGICERFHRTILEEFYQVEFARSSTAALGSCRPIWTRWIESYNSERTHSGKYCYGKAPMQTFLDAKPLADAKMIEKAYSGREPSRAPSPLYAAS